MSENLTPAEEVGRDVKADWPGVNTARDSEDAPTGSEAASKGVGHVSESKTEAARGTSG